MPFHTINPKAARKALNEEQLKNIFKQYDTNKDGVLDKTELKEAFRYFESRNPGWRAGRALHYADEDGDGKISEEELNDLVKYAVKLGYSLK